MQGRYFAIPVLIIALLASVAGCGGESEPPPPGTPSAAEYLVNPAVLKEQPKGSPQEGLMLWWRAIQYNDLQGYYAALAEPLRKGRENDADFRRQLALVSGELTRALPKIEEAEEAGHNATLFTRIETRLPVGSSDFTTSSSPQAFTLTREGKLWKINDDSYVVNKAEAIQKAQKAAEEAAK